MENDLKTDLTSLVLDAKIGIRDNYPALVNLCLDKMLARIESAADQPAPVHPPTKAGIQSSMDAINKTVVELVEAHKQAAVPVVLVRLSTDGYASAAIYGDVDLIIFDEDGLRANIENEYEDDSDPEIDKTYKEFEDEFDALYNAAPHNIDACYYPSDINDIKAAVQKRHDRP